MIAVVSGLPRSGTSLMMQILKAGGMEILTDDIRKPDASNPKGYYEFEKVKSLKTDNSWLEEAEGKVIKVIAQLIPYLPLDYEYRVLFMERDIDEVMISQDKMLENAGGKKAQIDKNILKTTFLKQAEATKKYLNESKIKYAVINYNEIVRSGKTTIKSINDNLGLILNIETAVLAIDNSLYRNRI